MRIQLSENRKGAIFDSLQDARAFIADRLDDIEGDVHEPESPL
jgi:hypothetical protein